MAYRLIMVEKTEGIATITLNRPNKLNPMNEEILGEMAQAIDAINDDDDTKAIIITGAGRAFSAAIELTKMAIYRGLNSDLASHLGYEAWAWGVAHETRDAQEGLRAFAEKRPARFEGR